MTPEAARRRAEQAVVRAALERGWLTAAQVAATQASGQPLLQALRAHLDAGQQQALARVHHDALAHPAITLLVSFRWPLSPDVRVENLGFRVAR